MQNSDEINDSGYYSTSAIVGIETLFDLLGYNDTRAIMKFCKKNKIPTLKLGKRTYVASAVLDKFIEDSISKSTSALNPYQQRVKRNEGIKMSEISDASRKFLDNK